MIARLRRLWPVSTAGCWRAAFLLAFAAVLPAARADDDPLRTVIDQHMSPGSEAHWPIAPDAEFLRRVSLDLTGMPPSADEARGFISDTDPAKREALVDRLLESPHHVRHFATTLDVMLMERRPNTHVPQDEWQAYLLRSVRENKPWNVLVRELLTADGNDAASRAAARFYLDRNAEPHPITRDIGRMFFGRDMQCNQCHDSPIVSDFLQRDYHGLLAFTSTGYAVVKKVDGKDITVFSERSPSDLSFESVFDKGNNHRTGARIPGGETVTEPAQYPGDDYVVAPGDGVRAVPKFSRRAMLAELTANGTNRLFNENIANRLWGMMFGRGLVHPLDMMHPDNPAVSPELLRILGQRIAGAGYDMRSFLREIALSQTYQRPFDASRETISGTVQLTATADAQKAALELADSAARVASAETSRIDDAHSIAESTLLPVAAELDAARTQYAEARKKLDDAQKAFNDTSAALNGKKASLQAILQALDPLQSAISVLPESPELAAAATVLSDRVTALTAELPALEIAVTEKTVAVTPVSQSLVAARTSLDAVLEKIRPFSEAIRAEEARFVVARDVMQQAQHMASSARTRLAALERIEESVALKEKSEAALRDMQSTQEMLTARRQSILATSELVTEQQKALAVVESAMANAEASLNIAQKESSDNRSALTLLTEASTAISGASASLPSDQTLTAAALTLKDRALSAAFAVQSSDSKLQIASQNSTVTREALSRAQTAMSSVTMQLQKLQEEASRTEEEIAQHISQYEVTSLASRKALEVLPGELSNRFLLSQLRPLNPEQMCWSVFKVTTVYDRYWTGEAAELEKTAPLTDAQKQDLKVLSDRQFEIEQRTFDKLKGHLGSYIPIYGGGPGQPQDEFYASPDQALFTANGGAINSWVVPAGDNAAERIVKATDPRLAAEELYLGVLTRMPTELEVSEVTDFLANRPDRSQAAAELVWGLISSAEFRFNR
jgi:hypothetical protein